MTTDLTESSTTPGSWREERRADRQLAEQIRREREEASRKARREEQAAADKRRRERRQERAAAREAAQGSAGAWAAAHFIDLMFIPVIAVPAWLGWDAMTNFGHALYGPQGGSLPLLSEATMWIFEFAINRVRKAHPNAPLWPLYVGLIAAALLCAVLNYMHGLDGPIPGTVPSGPGPGFVYAVVSVSGLAAHQVVSLAGRARHAAESAASADAVAGLAARLAETLDHDDATQLAENVGGDAAKLAAGLAADLAGAVADRNRLARQAADLTRQIRELRDSVKVKGAAGNAGKGNGPDNPNVVVASGSVPPKDMMRDYWNAAVAAGRIPNGVDLNRARQAGDYSLGRKYAKEWRGELPPGAAGNSPDDEAADEAPRPGLQAVAV